MRIPDRAVVSHIGVLAWICLALAPGAVPAYTLDAATVTHTDGQIVLEVSADETIRYDVFQMTTPDRVVVDLLDAETPLEPLTTGDDATAFCGAIRQSLWRDEPDGRVVRYVLETSGPAQWGVTAEGNRLKLCVSRAGDGSVLLNPDPDNAIGALAMSTVPASAGAVETTPHGMTSTAVEEAPCTTAGETSDSASLTTTASPGGEPVEATTSTETVAEFDLRIDKAPPLGAVDPAVPAVALASPPEPEPVKTPPMSLDVQQADIRTVLRSIAEFGKVNIVPDRDVEGPVSVRLVGVPWRQALDVVCESASLSTIDREDVIRVATRQAVLEEDIDREASARKHEELLPLETAILPVNYANAEELRTSVSFVLSKRGSAEVDARTNSILISDIPERIQQVRDIVNDLDAETPQVEIVAKLVDVDMTSARQLGITWTVENLHSTGERLSGSITNKTGLKTSAADFRFGMVRDLGYIDATLQALEQENLAHLLSNPRITTVNNRKARILVGKEVPLIVLDESGNPITELKKVGITLEVTPYINAQNRVTMDLHPEVSDLSSQSTVQGGIVFTTTEADTRVMVADGETAVIGGLIAQVETNFEQGIPVLRSIPLLGHLFKTSDVRKASRELMIFVTPRIVHGSAGVPTESTD